jgi:hypothetical protein
LGQFKAARDDLEKALEIDPSLEPQLRPMIEECDHALPGESAHDF